MAMADIIGFLCQKPAILFQSNDYQQLFSQHNLADFSAIWSREIAWFEPPNHRRGGWSGVGTISLEANKHRASGLIEKKTFFVKKQENHGRISWRHPFAGEPTFRREFKNLTFLNAQNIGAPSLVYYAENIAQQQAILITEELLDYAPLDTVNLRQLSQTQLLSLINIVAAEIKRFHQTGLVHRALYPKHVFVKSAENTPKIALIDLEKARFSPFAFWRTYFDLAAFTRHADNFNDDDKILFLNAYFGKINLNFFDKLLCKLINRRANRE